MSIGWLSFIHIHPPPPSHPFSSISHLPAEEKQNERNPWSSINIHTSCERAATRFLVAGGEQQPAS